MSLKDPAVNSIDRKKIVHWIGLLNDVYDNAEDGVQVLNDILNYDKVAEGTLTLDYSTFEVGSLVERTANEFKLLAKKKRKSNRKRSSFVSIIN
jgi:hypothetical protein